MHFIESNMPSVLRSIFQGESFHNVYVYLVYFKYLIVLFVNYISKKIFFKEASKRETKKDGESPGGPEVRALCFHRRGTGSIPGRETDPTRSEARQANKQPRNCAEESASLQRCVCQWVWKGLLDPTPASLTWPPGGSISLPPLRTAARCFLETTVL